MNATEAEKSAKQKTTTKNGRGIKYSIATFPDGNQYVVVDIDQARFDGLTPEEMRKEAKKAIKEHFVGKVIGDKNKAFVKKDSAEEYAYPSKFIKDTKILEAKMRAAPELDNLVESGTNFRNEPDGRDGHIHPEATGGFDYYDTVFKVGKNYYYGLINIMVTDRGRVLKDITQIEDITNDIIAQYGNPQGDFVETSSKHSIPNSPEKVNNKSAGKNDIKQSQFKIIQETNPMWDDYHTGIRTVDDIRTWEEVLELNDEREGQFVWGDFSREDAEQALKDGTITVYSSYPIKNGVFVSTSHIQAQEYAGGRGSRVYSKTIPLTNVAWINGDEGQYAQVDNIRYSLPENVPTTDSRGVELSKGQQSFFAESWLRDELGRLMVLYHGTQQGGFTVFDRSKSDDRGYETPGAIFLVADRRMANTYTDMDNPESVKLPKKKPDALRWLEGDTTKGKGQKAVYELYANLENPLIIEGNGRNWNNLTIDAEPTNTQKISVKGNIEGDNFVVEYVKTNGETAQATFTRAEVENGKLKEHFAAEYNKNKATAIQESVKMMFNSTETDPFSHYFTWDLDKNAPVKIYNTNSICAIAEQRGHDGVIFKNITDYGKINEGEELIPADVIAVFNPEAIKSVDNLNPTKDKDIRYSLPEVDIANLTETQYNNFGWVRANDVLTTAEYSTLISRYADYRHNKDRYPTTRFGEAVIHSSDYPDVLMYVKGDIESPKITKLVVINKTNIADISTIREEIILNENERQLLPYSFIEAYYGTDVLVIHKARDYATYRQFRAEQERSNSQGSNTFGGTEQNRRRGTAEGEGTGGTDVNYSLPEKVPTTDRRGMERCKVYKKSQHIGLIFLDRQ